MSQAPSWRTASPLLCAIAAALGLAVLPSCDGDGNNVPTPVTTQPPPPPPRVVHDGSYQVPSGFAFGDYFSTDRTGTLEAVIDYTFPASVILVWIARGQCTAELWEADQCTYAATSFAGGKPRRVSVAGATAGTYTLVLANFGDQDEAVSFQVILTPTAAAAAAAEAPVTATRPGWFGRTRRGHP
jgi:hypothetical protein